MNIYEFWGDMSKESIMGSVTYRFTNGNGCLDPYPSFCFLGMEVAYVVVAGDWPELDSFIVTYSIMEDYGISVGELDEAAKRNTQECSEIMTMAEVLAEGGISVPEEENMLVLTNRKKWFGATAILLPSMLEATSGRLGGDFYILPSSIHEVLAVPAGMTETGKLYDLVESVNDDQVLPEERLSYTVYMYDSKKKAVEVAKL